MPIDRHKTYSDRQSEAARAKKLAVKQVAPPAPAQQPAAQSAAPVAPAAKKAAKGGAKAKKKA